MKCFRYTAKICIQQCLDIDFCFEIFIQIHKNERLKLLIFSDDSIKSSLQIYLPSSLPILFNRYLHVMLVFGRICLSNPT